MKLGKKYLAWIVLIAAQSAQAAPTQVTWLGHAAFRITTPKGIVIYVDPWLNNPVNPHGLDSASQADYILITHGHSDHVGDAVALAKKTKARLICSFELGANIQRFLGFPESQVGYDGLINPGGEITIAGGEVKIAATPAVHSSGMDAGDHGAVYGGSPMGFVIQIKDGPTVYDTGDTAYFSDMKVIGEHYKPDLALINISGHFGMEPDMAARAALDVHAKYVVPQHFKTMPILTQDPAGFVKAIQGRAEVIVMKPTETINFDGHKLSK